VIENENILIFDVFSLNLMMSKINIEAEVREF
jgi:hypothetical protein